MLTSISSANDVRAYKPFIDGLRAVAIITVVGSHVNFPGFGGGYVGVDIFFVISGYLIINQIIADIEKSRFSIFDFYARRTLRILPAFLLVMVICLVLITTVFVQPEYKQFAETFFFSGLMVANHTWLAHQGYFDTAAFTKPLLHMWSLAVEEQFYWVAPFILVGMSAMTRKVNPENVGKVWAATTLGLGVVSLAACIVFTYPSGTPNVSFYIMPTRGWEFILGGITPSLIPTLRRGPAWLNGCLALLGIAAIGFAVALFDADTPYPSYNAILPAFGATLLIVSGLADPHNSVARALSSWPMVQIGLISYALYLWHWPLISFARIMNYGKQNIPEEICVVALSVAFAALTYGFVESPIRRLRRNRNYRPIQVVAAGVAACALVASIGYIWTLRIAPYFLPALTGLEPIQAETSKYQPVLHRGMLLGDSHAAALAGPLQEFARRGGSVLDIKTLVACPPLLHTALNNERGEPVLQCKPFYQKVDFHEVEFAILAARWNFYLGLPPSDPYYRSYALVAEQRNGEPANPYEVLALTLRATITEAKHSHVERILIIGPPPEFPWDARYCVMRSIRVGVDSCLIARTAVNDRRARTIKILRQVAADFEGVRVVDPIDLFCAAKTCSPHDGRNLYFSDTNHLSTAGVERLYKANERDFLWALTGGDGKK